LDDSFYQNLAATLKSIAKKSVNIVVGDRATDPCDDLDGGQRTGTCVGILDKKLSRGVVYSFDDIDDELGKLLDQGLKLSPTSGRRASPRDKMINTHVSPLQVTLLSAEGEELQNEEYEDSNSRFHSERLWISRPSREYGEEYSPWRLFRPGWGYNTSPVFFPSFTFYAYLAIDPEIMKKTASIRVRLAR